MPFEDHDFPQVIPTPSFSQPGGPAPWHNSTQEGRKGIGLDRVRSSLRSSGRLFEIAEPPLDPAELAHVNDGDQLPITRRSAVLVALFEEDGEARVILTRRSFDLRNHRGEVALPGGRCDEDETEIHAALREAHEETDLAPQSVDVIGWLSPIVTFASGSKIQPVIGTIDHRPELTANADEVSRIFDVSLEYLLRDENFLEQRWRRDVARPGADADGTFPIYFFRVPGEVIWGATGRILTELLSIVTGSTWPSARWVTG